MFDFVNQVDPQVLWEAPECSLRHPVDVRVVPGHRAAILQIHVISDVLSRPEGFSCFTLANWKCPNSKRSFPGLRELLQHQPDHYQLQKGCFLSSRFLQHQPHHEQWPEGCLWFRGLLKHYPEDCQRSTCWFWYWRLFRTLGLLSEHSFDNSKFNSLWNINT